jgi:protein-S-isoprenylcysteine O-methyltransferase Ste14
LGFFLLFGPIRVVDLRLSTPGALVLDGALCLMFCLQHSGMVRKIFQRRLKAIVPESCHGAVYAIASGAALLTLLVFWQPTDTTLFSVHGPFRWLFRGATFGAILGFLWGVRALDSLDAFGVRPIKAAIKGKILKPASLSIGGPYKWVRHPLYVFVVVLLWSYPDLTADRFLLNVLWTIWIYIGAVFEERDLVSAFGEAYRKYQRQVPMFLPLRIPRLR